MERPTFWKLSLGVEFFNVSQLLESIDDRLVYISIDAGAKGTRDTTQAEEFINAENGDYFYLTYGNYGIYLLGQFIGPPNYLNKHVVNKDADWKEWVGWIDRPFRIIARSRNISPYNGIDKWWAPNHMSTFIKVPRSELHQFEELILEPYFGISLSNCGF